MLLDKRKAAVCNQLQLLMDRINTCNNITGEIKMDTIVKELFDANGAECIEPSGTITVNIALTLETDVTLAVCHETKPKE